MADNLALDIEIRENSGKGAARALRREGKVPAIIYGGKKGEVKASLSKRDLVVEYNKGGFSSKLFELKAAKETIKVLPREVQLHPVTDEPLHVDFLQVEDTSKVKVWVKILVTGSEKSAGLKRGGILNLVRRRVELLCPANNIPESLTIDISEAKIGDSVHISSVELPSDVETTIKDRNFTIATIAGKGAKEEEAAEATAEGEGEEAGEEAAE